MRYLSALLLICTAFGCAPAHLVRPEKGYGATLPFHVSRVLKALVPDAAPGTQLVYVDPLPGAATRATVYAVAAGPGGWQLELAPLPANLGRNGCAPPWEKREGDGRTPSGLFTLGTAFGSQPRIDSKLPYRQASDQDLWVDDPHSCEYNRWVRRDRLQAASWEELSRPDGLYRYALVLNYNTNPVLRGMGSAIFLHVERAPGVPSAGCVTLAESDLLRLFAWLDPARSPACAIGSPSALEAVARGITARIPGDLPPELQRRLAEARQPLALRRGTATDFFGAALPVPDAVRRQMLGKGSWRPGCPVGLDELSYLVVSYQGFDDRRHYGELVLHRELAALALDALQVAFQARFPLESLKLIEEFDADDERSMAAGNSSGFNCREVPGRAGVFSRHSYGAALDLNPRLNPYLRLDTTRLAALGWNGTGHPADVLAGWGFAGEQAARDFCRARPGDCLVQPPDAAPFLERAPRPGLLVSGDPALSAFTERGFVWGGIWRVPDYQHLVYPGCQPVGD
jgi:L,D-peptidoglycan transpeptidase YkuD (ErfK/YbiS/YcfS/YnhG family)